MVPTLLLSTLAKFQKESPKHKLENHIYVVQLTRSEHLFHSKHTPLYTKVYNTHTTTLTTPWREFFPRIS